ncbi:MULTISPECIES: DUF2516 family protein [Isoptericola]|uniref:DUF2516 family protein n=1 Tax=Isoptericola haloaureus TaxID=1542902 RepID=A0ABU7Z5G8_9MICO|nr:DUF2516 family protein [Isoptericola sp. AK164]
MIASLQFYVFVILAVVIFVIEVFALVDAVRRPAHAYTAEGKLSKPIWLIILGVATALGFLALPTSGGAISSLGFLSIVAVVAAIVYLVDVRPRLKPYGTGRGSGRSQGSNGW